MDASRPLLSTKALQIHRKRMEHPRGTRKPDATAQPSMGDETRLSSSMITVTTNGTDDGRSEYDGTSTIAENVAMMEVRGIHHLLSKWKTGIEDEREEKIREFAEKKKRSRPSPRVIRKQIHDFSSEARRRVDDNVVFVEPLFVDFARVLVGTRATRAVRVANRFRGGILVRARVQSHDPQQKHCWHVVGDASTKGVFLPPETFSLFHVEFSPISNETLDRDYEADLIFDPVIAGTDTLARAVNVSMHARSIPSRLAVDITDNLGVHIGSSSEVRLFNVGSEAVNVDARVDRNGEFFRIAPTQVRVPPGQSMRFTVTCRLEAVDSTADQRTTDVIFSDGQFGEQLHVPVRILEFGTDEYADEDLIRRLKQKKTSSSVDNLSVPSRIQWPLATVGCNCPHTARLTNRGQSTLHCALKIEQPIGFRGTFGCPSEIAIPPLKTVEIELSYAPMVPGKQEASLVVLCEESYLSIPLVADAEYPNWDLHPTSILNFGAVEDTQIARLPLTILNSSESRMRFRIHLKEVSGREGNSLSHFSLAGCAPSPLESGADEKQQQLQQQQLTILQETEPERDDIEHARMSGSSSSKSMSTAAMKKHGMPDFPESPSKSQSSAPMWKTPASRYSRMVSVPSGGSHSVEVVFQAHGYAREMGPKMHEVAAVVEFMPDFEASSDVSYTSDEVDEGKKRISRHQKVVRILSQIGFTHLQVPKSCQTLHLASNIGGHCSRVVPIRNTGNLPATARIRISLSKEPGVNRIVPEPERLVLEPGETKPVRLAFHPKKPGKMEGVVEISCGQIAYRLPLTAHADEVPLVICDRPIVNFGGVGKPGWAKVERLKIKNNGSEKCFMRLLTRDGLLNAKETAQLLHERETDWAGEERKTKRGKTHRRRPYDPFDESGKDEHGYDYGYGYGNDDDGFDGTYHNGGGSSDEEDDAQGSGKRGNVFRVRYPRGTLVLDPKEEQEVELVFCPSKIDNWRGNLILESAWGTQYKIPIMGYCGCSDIGFSGETEVELDLKSIAEKTPAKSAFTLHNTGDRPGYACITCPQAGTRFRAFHSAVVIPPGTSREISILYTAEPGDSVTEGRRSFSIPIVIHHGDEMLRRRRQKAKVRQLRLIRTGKQEGPMPEFDVFDDPFVGQDDDEYHDGLRRQHDLETEQEYAFDDFFDEEIFRSSMRKTHISLRGTVTSSASVADLIGVPPHIRGDRGWMGLDGEPSEGKDHVTEIETSVSLDDHSRGGADKPQVQPREKSSFTYPETRTSESKDTIAEHRHGEAIDDDDDDGSSKCFVVPKRIEIPRTAGAMTFLVTNPSSRTIDFSIEHDQHVLHVSPLRGSIGAFHDQRVYVSPSDAVASKHLSTQTVAAKRTDASLIESFVKVLVSGRTIDTVKVVLRMGPSSLRNQKPSTAVSMEEAEHMHGTSAHASDDSIVLSPPDGVVPFGVVPLGSHNQLTVCIRNVSKKPFICSLRRLLIPEAAEGTEAGVFQMSLGSSTVSIDPGASLAVAFSFKPTHAGSFREEFQIFDEMKSTRHIIKCEGVGEEEEKGKEGKEEEEEEEEGGKQKRDGFVDEKSQKKFAEWQDQIHRASIEKQQLKKRSSETFRPSTVVVEERMIFDEGHHADDELTDSDFDVTDSSHRSETQKDDEEKKRRDEIVSVEEETNEEESRQVMSHVAPKQLESVGCSDTRAHAMTTTTTTRMKTTSKTIKTHQRKPDQKTKEDEEKEDKKEIGKEKRIISKGKQRKRGKDSINETKSDRSGVAFQSSASSSIVTATPSSGDTSLAHGKKKRRDGLYLREETILFPMTQVGITRVQKLSVCNGSKSPIHVSVQQPQKPFKIRHLEFEIRPRSYVLVPIRFTPERAGAVFRPLTLMSVDSKTAEPVICDVKMYGEGWPSPIHISADALYFLGADHPETLELTNVSDGPVEFFAEVDPPGEFSVAPNGSISRNSTVGLSVKRLCPSLLRGSHQDHGDDDKRDGLRQLDGKKAEERISPSKSQSERKTPLLIIRCPGGFEHSIRLNAVDE
eukprot:TRINITY_DN119_c0_g2_i3.p1 TRINITY_DN119_c0_g2~~TRINITY_DN119_c0_g2_i3.p1  ORF type:complete len:2217 (+),score=725.67 TRINITY_DN119_c0_g2_i3:622-6651(+)